MASPFAALAAAAGAVVDSVYAEEFILEPRAAPVVASRLDVNARRVADAMGLTIRFDGVFVADGRSLYAEGRSKSDGSTLPIIAAPPVVDVSASHFTERPEIGDIVVRVETGDQFRVTDVIDRDLGRIVLHLVRIT